MLPFSSWLVCFAASPLLVPLPLPPTLLYSLHSTFSTVSIFLFLYSSLVSSLFLVSVLCFLTSVRRFACLYLFYLSLFSPWFSFLTASFPLSLYILHPPPSSLPFLSTSFPFQLYFYFLTSSHPFLKYLLFRRSLLLPWPFLTSFLYLDSVLSFFLLSPCLLYSHRLIFKVPRPVLLLRLLPAGICHLLSLSGPFTLFHVLIFLRFLASPSPSKCILFLLSDCSSFPFIYLASLPSPVCLFSSPQPLRL